MHLPCNMSNESCSSRSLLSLSFFLLLNSPTLLLNLHTFILQFFYFFVYIPFIQKTGNARTIYLWIFVVLWLVLVWITIPYRILFVIEKDLLDKLVTAKLASEEEKQQHYLHCAWTWAKSSWLLFTFSLFIAALVGFRSRCWLKTHFKWYHCAIYLFILEFGTGVLKSGHREWV